MARDRNQEIQKRIVRQAINSGNGPGPGLTEKQAAAQAAVQALAALTELAGTVSIKNVNLGELAACWGAGQLANDIDLWAQAAVTDWIEFDNQLARAGTALYQAADLRGMQLHRLVEARLLIDAEIKERANHSQR